MKLLSRKILIPLAVLLVTILVIVLFAFSDNTIKLSYEISIDKVSTNEDYSLPRIEQGIQCGSVEVLLGEPIDITPYTVTKEINKDGIVIKQLLAPSKKYEVVVVGSSSAWYVQQIRTTVPGVLSSYGFGIGDSKKDVESYIDIPNRKKVTIKEDGSEVNLEFISDILVVMNMRCV